MPLNHSDFLVILLRKRDFNALFLSSKSWIGLIYFDTSTFLRRELAKISRFNQFILEICLFELKLYNNGKWSKKMRSIALMSKNFRSRASDKILKLWQFVTNEINSRGIVTTAAKTTNQNSQRNQRYFPMHAGPSTLYVYNVDSLHISLSNALQSTSDVIFLPPGARIKTQNHKYALKQ